MPTNANEMYTFSSRRRGVSYSFSLEGLGHKMSSQISKAWQCVCFRHTVYHTHTSTQTQLTDYVYGFVVLISWDLISGSFQFSFKLGTQNDETWLRPISCLLRGHAGAPFLLFPL